MATVRRRTKFMTFDLSGFGEVQGVIKGLGEQYGNTVERRLARAALGAALTIASKAIKAEAPARWLKNAVGQRHQRQRGRQIYGAKAGLSVGSRFGRAPHAHFFVLGTSDRYTKTGSFRGRVNENVFVKQAIERADPKMIAAMIERVRFRLPIELQNLRRKKARGRLGKLKAVLPIADSSVIIGGNAVFT